MFFFFTDPAERVALRIGITGAWTAGEFASFLQDTEDAYQRVNSVFLLSRLVEEEQRVQKEQPGSAVWHQELFGTWSTAAAPYEDLLKLTRAASEPLLVDSISYASPGWLQIIGDMNPMRVLADFITKWRAENTKREANRMKHENERFRIQSELAASILQAAPKLGANYEGGAPRLVDLAESVIRPASNYISRAGADRRVLNATIVKPGSAPTDHQRQGPAK
jgi:hypothetical protein